MKVDFCLSLGADEGFNYKEVPNWDEKLLEKEPNGVDMILDSIGASYFDQNIKCLKTDAYFIIYGFQGGQKLSDVNLGPILGKRLKIFGSTLKARTPEYKAKLIRRLEAEVFPKFVDGTLKSIVQKTFPVENARAAHEMMESNLAMGKIVLTVDH